MDLQTYREASREIWDRMAPGWEERREWMLAFTGAINDWILEHVDPQPGQRILDVAAGLGDLGFGAADRVLPGGEIVCTDFSREMIDAAHRNAQQRGLTNIDFRVLDAEDMDLETNSVDGVASRFSYMLMADPAAAFAETRRVLRDNGTLAFAVWQSAERNAWAALPGMVLVEQGHVPPPEPGAPGIFAMGDPARITELVAGAGFEEPRIVALTFEWRYASGEIWETLNKLAGPLAAVIAELSPDEQQHVRELIEARMDQYRVGDELVVPAAVWGVTTG